MDSKAPVDDEVPLEFDGPLPERPRGRRARGPLRGRVTAFDPLTRRLAIGAGILALVALGLTTWKGFFSTASACQSRAWDAAPVAGSLPIGWTTSATQFDPNRLSLTLVGPAPVDQTSSQPVIYATVSCFADDAAGAVSRSRDAAAAEGQTVSLRTDLGDQGYTALTSSGVSYIEFRRGSVVVAIAASGAATSADVEAMATALDRQLGGTASAATPPAQPSPTDAGPSTNAPTPGPSASTAALPSPAVTAPELEAILPATIGGVPLTINSATGSSVLGTDPGSRAIAAALDTAGIPIDDFHAAEAYDPGGTIDLSIVAFRVVGMPVDDLRKIVLETWLAGNGTGVTTKTTTLGGRSVTQVDYGDGGTTPYLVPSGDAVLVINTTSPDLAAEVLATLP
ncbi:MAG: hypothetical protein HYX54_05855 [Chloroflexi bacterium]|nr:hypothetical protein [Chloroflexota bacterium]